MPQSPEPPVKRRLRVVRRRIAAGALATFVAAWLAVAALGKGGSAGTAATSGAPATGAPSRSDDGAGSAQSGGDGSNDGFGSAQNGEDPNGDGYGSAQGGEDPNGDGFASPQGSEGSSNGPDSGSSHSGQQGGPVTTGQS